MAEKEETAVDQPIKQQPLDGGSNWLNLSLTQINERLRQVDGRFDRVERRVGRIDKRLGRLEKLIWTAVGGVIVVSVIFGYVAVLARDALLLWMEQLSP